MIITNKKAKNKLLSLYVNVVQTDESIHFIHPIIRNLKTHIDINDVTDETVIIKFLNNRRSFSIEFLSKKELIDVKKRINALDNTVAIIEFSKNDDEIDLVNTKVELYEI